MKLFARAAVRGRDWRRPAGRASGFVLAIAAVACSSSKAGPADSGTFGGGDGATTSHLDGGHPRDTGGGTTTKDSSTSKPTDSGSGGPGDAGCGTNGGSGWCQANAPTQTGGSMVQCDDFDLGSLSSAFSWTGVTRADLVATHYVSPYCALQAAVGDAGSAGAPNAAFTSHTTQGAPATGKATLAFDLFVPGGSSCEGAVVAYLVALPGNGASGAVDTWLKLSNITGTGDSATSYKVSASAFAGASPGSPGGATPSTPASVTVTPRASDKGWARLELDDAPYTIAVGPADSSVSATVAWFDIGSTKAVATSTATSTKGVITTSGQTLLEFDVGVLPDAVTGVAVGGCQVFIDNFVSNATPH